MRIGIVNDLPIAVEALKRTLARNPSLKVVWVAHDGNSAVAACAEQTPDLVLMDLIMPGMDGVEATRRIMASTPCAILIVTASIGANAWRTFEAMSLGALDAVDAPELGIGDPRRGSAALLAKIETIGRMICGRGNPPAVPVAGRAVGTGAGSSNQLLAIGASAGGPGALATLLSGLPRDFPAAVVIIQHVDEQFAAGMAEWLDQQSAMPVRIALQGHRPTPGTVLMAGTSNHLVLTASHLLGYTSDPINYVYRPSVDVFFQSLCEHWQGDIVGVLLTGMGRDGAVGLKALRNKGCHTIAQDAASSAVFGMPKAAAALHAAIDILPLDQIAPRLRLLLPQ
jgi:two-component system, chemotaxis family, response regulator WspF